MKCGNDRFYGVWNNQKRKGIRKLNSEVIFNEVSSREKQFEAMKQMVTKLSGTVSKFKSTDESG